MIVIHVAIDILRTSSSCVFFFLFSVLWVWPVAAERGSEAAGGLAACHESCWTFLTHTLRSELELWCRIFPPSAWLSVHLSKLASPSINSKTALTKRSQRRCQLFGAYERGGKFPKLSRSCNRVLLNCEVVSVGSVWTSSVSFDRDLNCHLCSVAIHFTLPRVWRNLEKRNGVDCHNNSNNIGNEIIVWVRHVA